MMEPPAFISTKKTYATYEKDLKRWTTLTTLAPEKQANMVIHFIPDEDPIKEKIDTQMTDTELSCKEGINNLLKFLAEIYKTDDMGEAYDNYVEFVKLRRKPGVSIKTFISEWENSYHKVKNNGCDMSDMVLAFNLLDTADLSEMDRKLVLTGVNYSEGKSKKTLLTQMKDALKKFVGRAVVATGETDAKAVKVEESTFVTTENIEKVLIMQGWKKPKGRTRIRSSSLPSKGPGGSTSNPNPNYKGKKNPLGPDYKPLKCFHCKCDHDQKCNCPCVYHLANNCPEKKREATTPKADLGLFMHTNVQNFRVEDTFLVEEESLKDEEDIVLIADSLDKLCPTTEMKSTSVALIDCACPTTVAGTRWIKEFMEKLPPSQKKKIKYEQSKRVFKFGGGEKRNSKAAVILPCNIAGKNVSIKTEVVEADIPLLVGNTTLKKADAILYISKNEVELLGVKIAMKETKSGHFSIEIKIPKVEKDQEDILCLLNKTTEDLNLEEIKKLHHYWGHAHVEKLKILIKNSGRLTKQVENKLKEVGKSCESCRINSNRKPTPKISIPKASKVNQVVSIDLKEYGEDERKYILYCVDVFSRFTIGVFIPNKKPETIGGKLLEKWISVLGVMDVIHSDLGGEFINEDLVKLAEYLDIKQTSTAAYSPNMNGCNERNHAIVDRMMEKMLFQDPGLPPEIALCWALNAKNSLENYQGFSPSQIVFGKNPKLPAVYSSGPPGFEEVSMCKSMADHINALHSAREAFIECESDRVIKKALKQRIYAHTDEIKEGDWIYFKNKSKRWEGPVKVTTTNRKLLYAVRGGRLLTINSDHAKLVKSNENDVVPRKAIDNSEEKKNESKSCTLKKIILGQELKDPCEQNDLDMQVPAVGNDSDRLVEAEITGSDTEEGGAEKNALEEETQVVPGETNEQIGKPIDYKQLKPNLVIKFKKSGETDWNHGRVHSRAGKATTKKCKGKKNKYENWWNVHDIESGHIEPLDAETFDAIEAVEDEHQVGEEAMTYAVNVPRYRHGEKMFLDAKQKELKNFDIFDVYEEVEDVGQPKLGTNWVCTEKIKDSKIAAKARLTIRGDMEDVQGIRTDSPTVMKGNINILIMLAAMKGWKIKTCDVTAAFLQTKVLDRDVFVLPPKERRIPGVLWKLKKPVYGLDDASRSFYLNFSEEMQKLGCEKTFLDPAMFLFFGDEQPAQDDEYRDPVGMAVTHVDDVLYAGEEKFEKEVIERMKHAFKF